MRRFTSEALLALTVEIDDLTAPVALTVRLGPLDITAALPVSVRLALEDEAAAHLLENGD